MPAWYVFIPILAAYTVAYTVSSSSQIADLNRELGRIEGTLAATEGARAELQGIEDMAIVCRERTARIEGYLEAVDLLAELKTGQQVIDIVDNFRQQMDSP